MSKPNSFKEISKKNDQFSNIKALLKDKNLNPNKVNDLKNLLSLTLDPIMKRFNFKYLLIFLLKYLNAENESIFYEYFFQSCELGKIQNVKILLEENFDVNCQNELGETPLHIAIAKNDIELIKLLIKYEPETNIPTYKDNCTVLNYAEFCGDKNIIEMIKELDENNKNNNKKNIQNEIVEYINNGMNNIKNGMNNTIDTNSNNDIFKDRSYSFISKNNNNLELIQNYNGEKMSIATNSDMNSSLLTIHLNNNIQNSKFINYSENKYINTQTIINESDYNEENSFKNKNNANSLNEKNKISKQISNDNKLSSSFKKKEENVNHLLINPSYIQSLKTSHTLNKEHLEFSSPVANHFSLKPVNKKEKIFKFIEEINLPKEYANYLIDNGFDVLDVLISQTKKGIALSYQNLKDIGIKLPAERSKIIVHLEEISGNFDFCLDRDIIYSNNIMDNNNSLYKFLCAINYEKLLNKFIDAGYCNSELLFVQMYSKQPINESILRNDLNLNTIEAKKILAYLTDYSQCYIKKRKNNDDNKVQNKFIIFEENNNIKSCDMCFIF